MEQYDIMEAIRRMDPLPCLLCGDANAERDRMVIADPNEPDERAWIFDLCSACQVPHAGLEAEILTACAPLPLWGTSARRPRGFRLDRSLRSS